MRRFHYTLQPLQAVRSDQVLDRAQQLRQRAATVGPPPGSEPPPQQPILPELLPPGPVPEQPQTP